MRCYLVDVDGTVADGTHRLHHIQKAPKDWDAFFDACLGDTPIAHICDLVWQLRRETAIVYVSGRSDRVRDQTVSWLMRHNISGDALYMRKAGDFRADDIIKIELLTQIRADGYEPIMAFEDRSRVVAAWRAAGIPCLQVAEGDF